MDLMKWSGAPLHLQGICFHVRQHIEPPAAMRLTCDIWGIIAGKVVPVQQSAGGGRTDSPTFTDPAPLAQRYLCATRVTLT